MRTAIVAAIFATACTGPAVTPLEGDLGAVVPTQGPVAWAVPDAGPPADAAARADAACVPVCSKLDDVRGYCLMTLYPCGGDPFRTVPVTPSIRAPRR